MNKEGITVAGNLIADVVYTMEKEIQTPVLSDQAIPCGRPILAEQQGCRKETFSGSQYPWWYL